MGVLVAVHTNDSSLFDFASSIISPYDSVNQKIVAELKPIIDEQDTKELINYSERQKVMFAQTRPELIFESDHAIILNSFEDLNLKGLYIAASMDWFTKYQIPELNDYYWERLPETEMNEYTINELNYQYLNMLTLSYRFNEIIERIPTMTFNANRAKDVYRISGMALQALGDSKNAKIEYENAIDLDGLNPILLTDVSKFYKKTQSKKEAYELISTAVQLYPNHTEVNKEFCIQALENEDFHTAEQTLRDLSDLLSPENFDIFEKRYMTLETKLGYNSEDW
jgi:tetratricopeptide (TPR) repeat protein